MSSLDVAVSNEVPGDAVEAQQMLASPAKVDKIHSAHLCSAAKKARSGRRGRVVLRVDVTGCGMTPSLLQNRRADCLTNTVSRRVQRCTLFSERLLQHYVGEDIPI